MGFVGIDFGTTNSAFAIADDYGAVQLVPLAGAPHWRTVLYLEPGGGVTAGAPAIARYLEPEGDGRLVQSIKSHLASAAFSRTAILGRNWRLEDMIAVHLREIRAAAAVDLGTRAVVGRPVRYWGAEDAEDDDRAVARMREALGKAGFDEVVSRSEESVAKAPRATASAATKPYTVGVAVILSTMLAVQRLSAASLIGGTVAIAAAPIGVRWGTVAKGRADRILHRRGAAAG